ncbi:MAG: UDP-2,3-diacylglucosamine diphosphatase [Longimicrobiales bacterium]
MSKADYIVSDIHLGGVPAATERAFVAFLRASYPRMRSLLINGDLFDFWFEWGGITVGDHFRALAALADLVDGGTPVTLVGGNHDAWGGAFLERQVGLRLVDGPLRMRLGDRETLIAHGDGVGHGDIGYRALRALIRSRPATLAFRTLHPELGLRLARAVSTTSEKQTGDGAGRARHIRDWAIAQLAGDPELELVVCGHAHVAEIEEVRPGAHYVNAGDWLSRYSYAVLADGEPPRLETWRAQAATP